MIDDISLVHIFQLKKLQELKLSKTEITDHGFVGHPTRKKFKATNGKSVPMGQSISSLEELEVLNIDFCKKLTSHSFNSIQLKKLKHFSAQGTHLSGDHMLALSKNCPKIESLNMSNCNHLRENDIQAIMMLKELETLELESCLNVDLLCMKHIMTSKKLQTLNVSKCIVDIVNSTFEVRIIFNEMFSRINSLRRIILQRERLYRCNYVEE